MWILTHNHHSPTWPKRKTQSSNNFVFIASEKNPNNLAAHMLKNHEIRRCVSYTKEQKLAAVSHATTKLEGNDLEEGDIESDENE